MGTIRQWRVSRWRRVVRHPVFWWVSVAAVAALTALTVGSALQRADSAQREWGETVQVAILIRPVGVGDELVDAIEWRNYPAGMVPTSAVVALHAQDVASAPMVVGEILLGARVTGDGFDSSLASSLPPDMVAIAVPIGNGWPRVEPGSHVDLFAQDRRVAADAVILEVNEQQVTVMVDDRDVGALAVAVNAGAIVGVLTAG